MARATDQIVLSRNHASGGEIQLRGSAGLVRVRGAQTTGWALLDGTLLSFSGRELHRSEEAITRVGLQ